MLLIITSTSDELLRNVNVDDLKWPWTLKILVFSDFLVIFGCKRVNCDEMDRDRPRLLANRNCCRLLRVSWALAQISCCNISALISNWQALYYRIAVLRPVHNIFIVYCVCEVLCFDTLGWVTGTHLLSVSLLLLLLHLLMLLFYLLVFILLISD